VNIRSRDIASRNTTLCVTCGSVAAIFVVNSGALIASPAIDQFFGIEIWLILPRADRFDDIRDEPQWLPVEGSATNVPIDLQESSGLIGDPPALVTVRSHNVSISGTPPRLYDQDWWLSRWHLPLELAVLHLREHLG
jgi:hypothetical protein